MIGLAFGLAVSACGSGGDGTPAAESASVSITAAVDDAVPPTADVEVVMVPTADGGQLDFNSLRGQDVLLWFWAPW